MGEKKRRNQEEQSDDGESEIAVEKPKKAKKHKKEKKEKKSKDKKKKRKKEKPEPETSEEGVKEEEDQGLDDEPEVSQSEDPEVEVPNEEPTKDKMKKTNSSTEKSDKDKVKEDRKRKRDEKKQKKKDILEQVPKRDPDGISYTKQQIRRMVRRVERGLPPVPTPEEEAELKRQDAQLRKEEELELAGMLYKRENDNDDENDQEEDDDDDNQQDGDDEEAESMEEDDDSEPLPVQWQRNKQPKESEDPPKCLPAKKRKLSKKPVPKDYVCQACKNKNAFPHWIYDCPDKVTVRGTNQVSAKHSKDNMPSAKKVFVSGLFFDTKVNDVKQMFSSCGQVTSCKLLKFADTKRCKGQAFVVFDTEASAKKALELSGTKISAPDDDGKSNKSKRELELKVHKMMSRSMTKARK